MTDISLFLSLKLNNNFELRVLFQCDLRIYSVETKKENGIVHLFEKNDTRGTGVTRQNLLFC